MLNTIFLYLFILASSENVDNNKKRMENNRIFKNKTKNIHLYVESVKVFLYGVYFRINKNVFYVRFVFV